MGRKSDSFKVIGETCQTVHTRVSALDFLTYAAMIAEPNSDIDSILRKIAHDAADIAQEYGASAIRAAMADEIHELRNYIDELKDEVDNLERENASLKSEIKSLEKELEEQ